MTISATAIYNVTTAEQVAFVLSTCESMATADNSVTSAAAAYVPCSVIHKGNYRLQACS